MSPRPRSNPDWRAEDEIDEKQLFRPKKSVLQTPKRFLVGTSEVLLNVLPQLCGRRHKNSKGSRSGHDRNAPMSLIVRADNGSQWQSIKNEKLSLDSTAKVMLISEELADKLLKKGDLWRKLSPKKSVRDDLGITHVCEYAIKVSYRWGNETSTRDAKIYISSQMKLKQRINMNDSMASVELLVPSSSATQEPESTSTVQPNYHLPPQTQEDKEREQRSNAVASKAHTDAMNASHTKKEKKFEEALRKPGTDSK